MITSTFLKLSVSAALVAGAFGIAHAADGPSDPQIVGIVIAANQIDIDYGKLALAKSKNKEVRDFAQRMITDHSAVQAAVLQLADKLGVKGEDSPTSASLKKGAADMTSRLSALKGAEFDKLYLENEAGYHKAVTDAVDAVLIPSARNAELKAALEGAQPLFLAHLEHARHASMGAGMGK